MIRDFLPTDDVAALTELLHRAYAGHAARGLRFFASYQTPDITAKRIACGRCFVAEQDGSIAGMICVYGPDGASPVALYREPRTFHFAQFAVDPVHRGRGLGRALHERVVRHAVEQGGRALALDTASGAEDLLRMYRSWGYREAGRHAWAVTNYESVVMRLAIGGADRAG